MEGAYHFDTRCGHSGASREMLMGFSAIVDFPE